MEMTYTIPEVAEYLKMSKSKVYTLVKKGWIPFIKIRFPLATTVKNSQPDRIEKRRTVNGFVKGAEGIQLPRKSPGYRIVMSRHNEDRRV